MALRQLGRRIPVLSRAATAGSALHRAATVGSAFSRTAAVGSGAATAAPGQLHRITGPLSYGFGASFPSRGAAFPTCRFFCTEPPIPTPLPRRTQRFLSFMVMFTVEFIKWGVMIAGGLTLVFVTCYYIFGFDLRRKLHKMLVLKREKKND